MPCNDCDLSKKCMNSYITGRGAKPRKSKIMILQDAPTYLDDRIGNQALNGDTRAKLNYFLEKSGIDYKDVYFTSAIKCRPKKISEIKNKHLDECRKYLFHEILLHKPDVIIAMGRWAYQAVTDHTSIREFRGHFDEFSIDYDSTIGSKKRTSTFECKVMPTWSLNASMGKWEYNGDMIRDFAKVAKFVKTGKIDATPPPVVNTILTGKGLKDFVEKYREVNLATTDFETTGFNFWQHKIINSGYCAEIGTADIVYMLPYKKEHTKKWTRADKERAREINMFLKKYRKHCHKALQLVNGFEHLRLILHNGKFDSKFALYNDIPYANFYFDTLLADPLIDENLGHSLNIACERRDINFGPYDTTEIWKWTNKDEKTKKSYQHVPPPSLEKYLGIDVDADMRLFKAQVKELKSEGMWKHMLDVKMPALRDMINTEYVGVKNNRGLIEKASRMVSKKQGKLLTKIVDIVGIEDFNPNSDVQMNNYMIDANYPFKKLKVKETTRGYSVAKSELEKFTKYKKWREFPQLVLNMKKLVKIKGTYIDGKNGDGGMLQYLDHNDRVHANFNMWTPRTSRYSCNRPSLQVWPRPIKGLPNARNFIIPENDDWELFEADYSQLEQCIVAALSKDKVLTKRIQMGTDLHCANAIDIGKKLGSMPSEYSYEYMMVAVGKEHALTVKAPIKLEDIPPDQLAFFDTKRTQAKGIGFGLNYGKGKKSFAEEFGITEDEAEEMIEAYFDTYSGMYEWREKTVSDALNKGFITLPSGRKRRFTAGTDWLNHDFSEGIWSAGILREEISRQAMNYPVQGGAHEVFEAACIRLNKRFRKEGLSSRILLSIHDGIVGESLKSERAMVRQCILEEMPFTFHAGTKNEITLKIDVDFYESCWYSKKIKE